MYEDFYGLKEKPFTLTPDPKFLYLSEGHRGALQHLFYGISQKEGFMLITGDVGTGKTTICRALLERLDQKTKTALILNPQISEEELLSSILSEFGITFSERGKKGIIDRFNQFLLQQLSSGRQAILIIDEAQNLSLSVMEQIRLLSNLETEKEKLLQIILVGQPELQDKLKLPVLRQLNQRISVRYCLTPLIKTGTKKYIEHRLMVAGSEGTIQFSNHAISLIHRYSQGIPRLINIICDRCLLGGFSMQTTNITSRIVKKVIESLEGGGIFPVKKSLFSFKRSVYFGIALLLPLTLFLILQGEIPISLPKFEESLLSKNIISSPKDDVAESSLKSETAYNEIEKHSDEIENNVVSYPYVIQLASFRNEKTALKVSEELKQRGYDAYISQVNARKGVLHCVLLGKFESKDTGNKMMQELNEKGILKYYSDAIVVETSYALGKRD